MDAKVAKLFYDLGKLMVPPGRPPRRLVGAPLFFFDGTFLKSSLGKYRYSDEEAYVEALHNMDSLFCLEKQIQLGEIKPEITDPPTATQYAVRALTHVRNLRAKIKEQVIYDEVTGFVKALEKITENHVNNIELLCRRKLG